MRVITLCFYKFNKLSCLPRNTSIPVPRVYCSFKHKGRVYILMKRIPGQDLSQTWARRSEESEARILTQLQQITTELRSIPPPDGIGVANVDGSPVFDQRLPDKSLWGPFEAIQDFHRDLRHGLELGENVEAFPGLRELINFHNGPWQKIVFTHSDLSSFNIMAVDDNVTGIVDWETAGWMPPYWEYTSAWHVNPHNDFWQDAVDRFLSPFPHELEMERYDGSTLATFSMMSFLNKALLQKLRSVSRHQLLRLRLLNSWLEK
ncbi:kinase-like domain-containing protein, partial [Fusarium flagelliforme]|uniref:kinase-like domain-containing protein n=1 Tax=Fusarium flagelliforme TaxID=2675880 RepID=UPI001E8E7908